MDAHQNVLYAAGLPALISTGITLIYLLLKTCRFAFYALSNKTEGRLAATMPCSGQQEHRSIEGEEGHTEVYEPNTKRQYRTVWHRGPPTLRVPSCTKKTERLTLLCPRGCYTISRGARCLTK